MNTLRDSKGKHKNGRNIDYTATTEVKQQSPDRTDILALTRPHNDNSDICHFFAKKPAAYPIWIMTAG